MPGDKNYTAIKTLGAFLWVCDGDKLTKMAEKSAFDIQQVADYAVEFIRRCRSPVP